MSQIDLKSKYSITAWFYDILDYYWERQYRHWRPEIVGDLCGDVLEAGVGTGRNLCYYPAQVRLTGIDQSSQMLRFARRRARQSIISPELFEADATRLSRFASDRFDWYISTFMYCVMADDLQSLALAEMCRVLKPGGRFRLIEMVYSQQPDLRRRQERFAPFVEKMYGARFDRQTLSHIEKIPELEIERTEFLKADTYLFIEGRKRGEGEDL